MASDDWLTGNADARDHVAAALASLEARLPRDPLTQLVDFATVPEDALEEVVQIAQGHLAVVVLRLHYDAAPRPNVPPDPCVDVHAQVLIDASYLVRANVRSSDLPLRVGPLTLAVVLLRAGPLDAQGQAARLRALMTEQRFVDAGHIVLWRARVELAAYRRALGYPGARRVFERLFAAMLGSE